MCGIAALVGFSNPERYQAGLAKDLRHRGPDGTGSFVHNDVLLVHTRLAIIDTSSAGNQPLFNEDRSIVLICNGEIYNFQELRSRLESLGHQFASHSDSEIIIHLYEEHKDEPATMLNMLRGMFAFVLLDTKRKQVLVARDRFGIKPLYFCQVGQSFAFASEIAALANLPFVSTGIDCTSLYEYVQFLSIPEPNTIYQDIKAVEAGSCWIIDSSGGKNVVWYDTIEKLSHLPIKEVDATTALSSKLKETMLLHMLADVSVGSFLSAGIDSTLVTKMAASCTNIPFTAVSASFDGAAEDESKEAELTAKALSLRHASVEIKTGSEVKDAEICRYFDQPFAAASAYSLFEISKFASRYMKVVLTGDGGDEVFAGYDHKHIPFYKHPFLKATSTQLRPWVGKLLSKLPGKNVRELGHEFLLSDGERFLNRNRIFSAQQALMLINKNFHSQIDTDRLKRSVDAVFERISHLPPVRQMLIADFATFLKSEMLYKVDRMTMANGIEARVPLLDHELVELAFSLPVDSFRTNGEGKLPLRKMVAEFLPAIANRKKTGFNTPKQLTASYLKMNPNPAVGNLLNLESYSTFSQEKKFYLRYIKNGLDALTPILEKKKSELLGTS